MIFLNWIPETAIFIQIFVVLVFLNFKIMNYRSLSLWVAGFSAAVLGYFSIRFDLSSFESPTKILLSDSLSYFGRVFSLLVLVVGSLSIHFHRSLPLVSKQRVSLFLLFFSMFLNIAFLSNSLLLFAIAWIGAYVAVTNIVLVESNVSGKWVEFIRQQCAPFTIVTALVVILFMAILISSDSLYSSDFVEWVKKAQDQRDVMIAISGMVIALGALLTHGMVLRGKGPLGLALSNLFLFCANSVFWFRIGVPFFKQAEIVPAVATQTFLGVLFGVFALRNVFYAIRTTDHDAWISHMFPAVIGMGWFLLTIDSQHALSGFYLLSIAYLMTFFLVGHAFLELKYKNKLVLIVSIFAILGSPPLIMGTEYFNLMRNAIANTLVPVALLFVLAWFGSGVSAIQMMGKVILVKGGRHHSRKPYLGEVFFLALYWTCVILLTAFRPALISLLNDHPVPYLW